MPVHPPVQFVCINIYGHVEDPVVHVRVRWNMKTLKQLACTIGWVAQHCHSFGEEPEFPIGQYFLFVCLFVCFKL